MPIQLAVLDFFVTFDFDLPQGLVDQLNVLVNTAHTEHWNWHFVIFFFDTDLYNNIKLEYETVSNYFYFLLLSIFTFKNFSLKNT